MKKLMVNRKLCIRCGNCYKTCSTVYHNGDNEKSYIKIYDKLNDYPEVIVSENCHNCGMCAKNCPTRALTVEEI